MKHPLMIALAAGLLVLLAAAALPLWQMLQPRAAAPAAASTPAAAQGLPWQIEPQADGTARVFGLRLGQATLDQAWARFGDGLQLALVARLGEVGTLEALVEPMSAGFVSGRLVLALDVPEATRRAWRERVEGSEPMEGGARRFRLAPADREQARQALVVGLSFVPSLRLSEADIRERFGAPARQLALADGISALGYPAQGLVAMVQPGVRGLLQYVAPRDFEARLWAPLLAAPAKASPASAPR
ncbi:MAG: hypothetical protein KBC73_06435 [Burkholderiaceae bacterium]|nr:hypothetical protein [Burkholderiaceae bacterium]